MATISFTTTFNLSETAPLMQFEDTSDYVGQGLTTADMYGAFKIVAPSGTTVYNKGIPSAINFDIENGVVRTNVDEILATLGTDGFPEVGTYTITYKVFNSDNSDIYTQINKVTYNYERPELEITQTVNCVLPLFTSTDVTDYEVNGVEPEITEEHTIYYPNGSAGQGSPETGTSTVLSTSTIYTGGDYTTTITSELVYEFPTCIIVDTLTGSQSIYVDCKDACVVYCGIRKLEQQMMTYARTNQTLYSQTTALFSQVMGIVGLIMLANRCGKSEDVAQYLLDIKALGNFTDDCGCGTNEPTLFLGLSGIVVDVEVRSGGTPVVVTPTVEGSTNVYTVSLSEGFINQVNTIDDFVVKDSMWLNCLLTYNTDGTLTIAQSNVQILGTNFVAPTIASVGYGGGTWGNSNNSFVVNAFMNSANTQFKVFFENQVKTVKTTIGGLVISPMNVLLKSTSKGSETFNFQFTSSSLAPYTNSALKGQIINVSILINQ